MKSNIRYYDDFAKNLEAYWLSKNMTQDAFANYIGVTRQTLQNWISGKTNPQLSSLYSLFRKCPDLDLNTLFGRDVKKCPVKIIQLEIVDITDQFNIEELLSKGNITIVTKPSDDSKDSNNR